MIPEQTLYLLGKIRGVCVGWSKGVILEQTLDPLGKIRGSVWVGVRG